MIVGRCNAIALQDVIKPPFPLQDCLARPLNKSCFGVESQNPLVARYCCHHRYYGKSSNTSTSPNTMLMKGRYRIWSLVKLTASDLSKESIYDAESEECFVV